ncbi:MAG TPA: branched-chain amino acid ABC transporter permease [Anaerolineae bacterium]|nr:branched-chain amino acid ABC transporter permease [Anaerolineae bacterium]
MKAAFPTVLGYVPIGLAFGALARQIQLPLWQIGLMSALVYAGSSQFIAVSPLGIGTDLLTIIVTTFLVNLRHLLMSSALSSYLRRVSSRSPLLLAFGVTDGNFAVNITRLQREGLPPFLRSAAFISSQTAQKPTSLGHRETPEDHLDGPEFGWHRCGERAAASPANPPLLPGWSVHWSDRA